MRGMLDFSSWSAVLTTLFGLVLVSLVLVGIRLVFLQTFQRRRERENRQINERLKVLIAAYKTLGGSFTGVLTVDSAHLRDLRRGGDAGDEADLDVFASASERRRRIRDAVEAALSDIILLGTEEQVRLAARAANEMVAGRNVEVAELVVALRNFIRQALDLTPVPAEMAVPNQGPLRVNAGGASARRGGTAEARERRAGGGGGAGGGGAGMGVGMGVGAGGGAAVAGGAQASDAP
jgi:heme exporter protein D